MDCDSGVYTKVVPLSFPAGKKASFPLGKGLGERVPTAEITNRFYIGPKPLEKLTLTELGAALSVHPRQKPVSECELRAEKYNHEFAPVIILPCVEKP